MFLYFRTDFYHVPEGQYENLGFPPGVAEEIVIKVLRTCDPNTKKAPNGARKPVDINNEIMCSTVAQEVEVIAEGDEVYDDEEPYVSDHQYAAPPIVTPTPETEIITHDQDTRIPEPKPNVSKETKESIKEPSSVLPDGYKPPMLPTQKNSETYNGAERETYSWSQNIMEIGR